MYRTILVGCDGSEHEAHAIALAEQLRDTAGGRVILANVVPFYRSLTGPGIAFDYDAWLRDRSSETLDRAEAAVTYGVPFERETIASASAAAGINDLAELVNADLIVLGESHRGSVQELFGRKTVQRLLHGAPCAVAVAAPGQSPRFSASPRICVAYNGSPEARYALETAYGIAVATAATVEVCLVLEPIVFAAGFAAAPVGAECDEPRREAALAELEEAVAQAPEAVTAKPKLLWGASVHAVVAEAAVDADLIVAGSRGFGALQRAIAGSTAVGLLTNGVIPVLVTPRVVAGRSADAPAGQEWSTVGEALSHD
jgi:nucleotide-binding universal stress UspA family protein